ncbi:MAG: septum formation initiator family protein [Clostridiales Family XIII bacterium]|jgi:cell division protein DivIC|nr:septum formation initiator family protein [Clostridiales Family XIII bacterium]
MSNEKENEKEKINASTHKRNKKRRRAQWRRRAMIVCAIIIAVVLLALSGTKIVRLMLERSATEEDVKGLESEKKELELEFKHIDDKEFFEQEARERLRMIRNGETLYLFDNIDHDKEDASQPSDTDKDDNETT